MSPRLDAAARVVLAGGVVAYPTEAVYGLGCLPHEPDALERILAIKRRSTHKGFVLIGASVAQIERFAVVPAGTRGTEIRATWPGPITWVLEARPGVPAALTGGRSTVAVRVTAHEIARRLCERVGSALVSTSANVSGRPPLCTALAVRRVLGRDVDFVLAGPLGGLDRPTMIRDGVTGAVLRA